MERDGAAAPLDAGADADGSGVLHYGGQAVLGGYHWSWEIRRPPAWLLRRPAGPIAAVLAAAGHPARFEILQLLATGPMAIADLQARLHLGSPGQLYHHLKTLTAAGLVEQPERGVYRVPPHAIFPVLALAAAAVDVAERGGAAPS